MCEEMVYHTPNGIIKKLGVFDGKRALVGDYSKASVYNTKIVLESLGIETIIVKSASEIIDRIKAHEKFDLIITNKVYSSGASGIELINELNQIDGFKIPVVLHSISDEPEDAYIKLGFAGYLKKPVRQDETIEILNKVLNY